MILIIAGLYSPGQTKVRTGFIIVIGPPVVEISVVESWRRRDHFREQNEKNAQLINVIEYNIKILS